MGGVLCHRGDTASLYSVADGGGLLLLPIAGRVPRPRGGMVCLLRVPFSPSPLRDPAVAGWRHLERFDVSAISFSPLFEVGLVLLD